MRVGPSTGRVKHRNLLIHNDSSGLCCRITVTHSISHIRRPSTRHTVCKRRCSRRLQLQLSARMMRRVALQAAAMCMLLALAARLTQVSPLRSGSGAHAARVLRRSRAGCCGSSRRSQFAVRFRSCCCMQAGEMFSIHLEGGSAVALGMNDEGAQVSSALGQRYACNSLEGPRCVSWLTAHTALVLCRATESRASLHIRSH